MTIDLVFITHHRLEYTRLALSSVLVDPTEEFSLTIWDNASTDGTVEYLKNEVNDRRIADIVFSKENVGQAGAMNGVWGRSQADLLGKLDNDCLVTAGWTRILAKAHEDIEKLGAVACWHYPLDEFDEDAVGRAGKIQSFGKHRILRHPWVCGTGFLMKRSTFQRLGPFEVGPDVGMTYYFLRMARRGKINGWYYPFVLQEHMDDPASKHTKLKNDAAVRSLSPITYTLRNFNMTTLEQRMERRRLVLHNILCDPWQAEYYVGWRGRWRRGKKRLAKLFGGGKPQV